MISPDAFFLEVVLKRANNSITKAYIEERHRMKSPLSPHKVCSIHSDTVRMYGDMVL